MGPRPISFTPARALQKCLGTTAQPGDARHVPQGEDRSVRLGQLAGIVGGVVVAKIQRGEAAEEHGE